MTAPLWVILVVSLAIKELVCCVPVKSANATASSDPQSFIALIHEGQNVCY